MARIEARRIWQEEPLPLFCISASDFIQVLDLRFPEGTEFSAEVGEYTDANKTILENKADIKAHLPLLSKGVKIELGSLSISIKKISNVIEFKEDQRATAEAILADLKSHVPFHRRAIEILAKRNSLMLSLAASVAIFMRAGLNYYSIASISKLELWSYWTAFMAPIIAFNLKTWMRPKIFYVERSNFFTRNKDGIIWAALAYLAGNLTPDFVTIKEFVSNLLLSTPK